MMTRLPRCRGALTTVPAVLQWVNADALGVTSAKH
jgi:hypothetical protein